MVGSFDLKSDCRKPNIQIDLPKYITKISQ